MGLLRKNTKPMESAEILAPGILKMWAHLKRHEEKSVLVNGTISFRLSEAIHSALSFLPLGMGKHIGDSLILKYLEENSYHFKVIGLATLECEVTSRGIMTLKASYHSLFAQPVANGETERIFKRFVQELKNCGVHPPVHEPVETFLEGFKNQKRGVLDFAALFEGRSLKKEGFPEDRIEAIRITGVEMKQDSRGDLDVNFQAEGCIIDKDERK